MSETSPVYSGNKVLSAIEHVGHWLHIGGTVVAVDLPKAITVVNDVKAQAPTAEAEAQAVIADVVALKPLLAALKTAAAGGAVNPAADLAVVEAFEAAVPTLTKIGDDVQTLATTVSGDFKGDAAALG